MKKLFSVSAVLLLGLFLTKSVKASEGWIDLTNRVNTQARCTVFSVFEQDLNYHMLFTCRDITYPGGVEVVNYIMWATPTSGTAPVRIGELGLGKGDLRTTTSFSNLFVTVERDRNTRTPSGQTIMQGAVK